MAKSVQGGWLCRSRRVTVITDYAGFQEPNMSQGGTGTWRCQPRSPKVDDAGIRAAGRRTSGSGCSGTRFVRSTPSFHLHDGAARP